MLHGLDIQGPIDETTWARLEGVHFVQIKNTKNTRAASGGQEYDRPRDRKRVLAAK